MALTCVNNRLGAHACTNYYTHHLQVYSGQQYNVPTISVYCVSKHDYEQLSSLMLGLYSHKMITIVTLYGCLQLTKNRHLIFK